MPHLTRRPPDVNHPTVTTVLAGHS
jgi:hypothetical protein